LLLLVLGSLVVGPTAPALAGSTPDPYHELETKYLFGFTEGSDIGSQGEQSFELETTAGFQRRNGRYTSLEQEFEYESVPSQYWGYEISAHAAALATKGTDGLADTSTVNFSGLSAEFRYLLVGRGPGAPVGVALIAEPEWARIDDGGQHITDFSSKFGIVADTELVANRLYAAVNLTYTPDIAQSPGESWSNSSQFGLTGGLAYRVTPMVTVGGETEYYRQYDSLGFSAKLGEALYVGPTLHIQFTPKIMLAAAFSTEVAGRATGESRNLDLTNFSRQRANLKLEFEF
jgi:opacity protein-like surface antigen